MVTLKKKTLEIHTDTFMDEIMYLLQNNLKSRWQCRLNKIGRELTTVEVE